MQWKRHGELVYSTPTSIKHGKVRCLIVPVTSIVGGFKWSISPYMSNEVTFASGSTRTAKQAKDVISEEFAKL